MRIFKFSMSLVLLSFMSFFVASCNNDTFTAIDNESIANKDFSMSAREGGNSELMNAFETKLLTDQSFITFAKSYFESKILISEIEIRKKIESNYVVEMVNDSTDVETAAVQSSLANLTLFYHNNKDFDLLTDKEKETVVNNVMMKTFNNVNQTLASNPNATFQENSLESAVVGFQNDFNDLVGTLPPTVIDPTTGQTIASTYSLTWQEVGGCAIMAVGSFIGNNWSVIKGIYSLLSGGAVTYNLALAAVGVICPQVKAIATIATFAACLVKEYIW